MHPPWGEPVSGCTTEAVGRQHTSLQPFPHQAQTGAVIDALAHHGQEPRVVQLVEEAFDIGLHHVAIRSVLQVEGEVMDRIHRPPSGAIAVATIQNVLFIDCRSGAAPMP